MLPTRLVGSSLKLTMDHLAVSSVGSVTNAIRSHSSKVEPDWANQTMDTITSEEVSFSESRKHKMDGDTCCHQDVDLDQYESMNKMDSINVKEDDRFHVYDPSSIGLSGVMQTNVPEPFDASMNDNQGSFITDHAVALNMPGGTIAQKTKYLSSQRNMLEIDQSRH